MARVFVRGYSREPAPPPRMMARTFCRNHTKGGGKRVVGEMFVSVVNLLCSVCGVVRMCDAPPPSCFTHFHQREHDAHDEKREHSSQRAGLVWGPRERRQGGGRVGERAVRDTKMWITSSHRDTGTALTSVLSDTSFTASTATSLTTATARVVRTTCNWRNGKRVRRMLC